VRVSRILDLTILLLLAVAILLPRPGVMVQAGLKLPQDGRDRVAELQARLVASPADAEAGLELADLFLDARRPEWALATLAPALDRKPDDHRLHRRRALALADHFEAGAAFVAASKALALCEGGSSAQCGDGERGALRLLVGTLDKVKGLDMRQNPNEAKERILKALHPVWLPKQAR
jgi:hypothetical protein